jgi:hypothetical protein
MERALEYGCAGLEIESLDAGSATIHIETEIEI